MGEHEARHAIGQRRLADALRAADQPGMRNAPAAIGIRAAPPRPRDARTARWFRADAGPRSPVRPCAALMPELAAARDCEEAIAQRGPDARGDRVGVGVGVDQHAALRILGGDLPIGVAQILMELEVFGLEAVGRAAAAPRRRALQADLDGNVEDDGQVRLEIADGDALHRIEHARRDLAQPALIGARRIREAVAQHPECPG